jgi:hypothetical protein
MNGGREGWSSDAWLPILADSKTPIGRLDRRVVGQNGSHECPSGEEEATVVLKVKPAVSVALFRGHQSLMRIEQLCVDVLTEVVPEVDDSLFGSEGLCDGYGSKLVHKRARHLRSPGIVTPRQQDKTNFTETSTNRFAIYCHRKVDSNDTLA